MATFKTTCPRCGRNCQTRREVTQSMRAWWRCKTCKILQSIDRHQRQIERLTRQVSDRRFRGL
jgi:hypothetical protein